MKHIVVCLLCLVTALFISNTATAESINAEQRETTLRFINSLQNADGGFRAVAAPGPSLVSATSSALRVFKNLGGPMSNKPEKVVMQCLQGSGGFSDTPGGKPDIRVTWMGVNAIVNMSGAAPSNMEKIMDFVSANAKNIYPDIYFATSIVEDTGVKATKAANWLAALEVTRNPDGTYGRNADEIAHAVVIILRLGGTLKDSPLIIKALKAAQSPDGSFSGNGKDFDIPGTYTVMRALWMLKEKPDLAAVRKYTGNCRNTDGGYGLSPGKPSAATPTYMASSVMRWADELSR